MHNPLRPCANCLRARRNAKRFRDMLFGVDRKTFSIVTTTTATITMNNATNRVSKAEWKTGEPIAFVGAEIYLAGQYVIDVAAARRKTGLGRIVRIDQSDS